MSAKQPGWLQNLWTDVGTCVHCTNTCPWHQPLWPGTWSTPHWHVGQHITKRHRRSSWSMKKAVTCKHEGIMTVLWTSAKLKPTVFRANTLHNRLFSEPPTVYREKRVVSRHFQRSYLQANKVTKSEWIRIAEHAYLMLLTENYKKVTQDHYLKWHGWVEGVYKSLSVFRWNYVSISYRFWDIQHQIMTFTLKWG